MREEMKKYPKHKNTSVCTKFIFYDMRATFKNKKHQKKIVNKKIKKKLFIHDYLFVIEFLCDLTKLLVLLLILRNNLEICDLRCVLSS